MNHLGTITLATDPLVLRRLSVDDAQEMYDNWASDPQVTRHLGWLAHPDVDESRSVLTDWTSHYLEPDWYAWGVTLRDSGVLIGTINVVALVRAAALCQIGYCYGRQWWGQGLATEALRAVTDFLIGQVGAHKVESVHDPRNPASGRVMTKAGLRQEGIRRQAHHSSLGICDSCYHGILANEWRAAQPD
ncbi:GNAT family N-acetyltransferase [Acidipropionibacterium jensenii]|uniref:GNAT family N-acetyltransferase n=1 Tax=Acidipropionibacterium jensenii TaxID=1749 RepID=UPI00214BCF12